MMNEKISGLLKFPILALLVLASLISFSQDISKDAAVIKAGEDLFNGNCKSCHRVKQKLVGPALAGVYDRAPSIDWIKNWVRNSSKVIASGDKYAMTLYNEYNKSQMTAFTSYKDDQIMAILAYVKAETDKVDAPAAGAPVAGGGAAQPSIPSGYLDAILGGMIIILILMLVILALITTALKKYLNEKQLSEEDSEVVNSPITLSSFLSSPGFIFLVVF